MIAEFNIPIELLAPDGASLSLNTALTGGRRYIVNPKRSFGRRSIRATRTDKPQGDGTILHKRWSQGFELQIAVQLWQTEEDCACDVVLNEMYDELRGHLWKYLRPEDVDQDGGRALWTPSGKDPRMMDAAKLLSLADPEEDSETGCMQIIFVLDSPFPYAISQAQTVTNINGIAGSVTNNGNVDFWPVLKIYTDGIDIVNNTTGKQISFIGGCLGGGAYIEVDTFRGTAYVDGDQANAKPCIDVQINDFFPLVSGANQIDSTGSVDFLVNDAFA